MLRKIPKSAFLRRLGNPPPPNEALRTQRARLGLSLFDFWHIFIENFRQKNLSKIFVRFFVHFHHFWISSQIKTSFPVEKTRSQRAWIYLQSICNEKFEWYEQGRTRRIRQYSKSSGKWVARLLLGHGCPRSSSWIEE